jgi:hypothetical protein
MANTTIPSELIAADAITGAKIADNAVDSEHYTDGSIDTAHIADSQVTVGKMAANSVDSDQYVDGSIDLIHMSVNSIDSDQYVDGSIDTAHIADAQITVGKMAANSVDSDQYVDGSIDTIHIADDAVTGAKIENAVTIATSVTSPLIDGTNYKINGAQGTDGQVMTSTGSGVAWETPVVTDTTILENNIAILGFYRASDNSKAKYNLVDQIIDEYYDNSGIDTEASTGEVLSGSGATKYYAGATSSTGSTITNTYTYDGTDDTITLNNGESIAGTIMAWGGGGGGDDSGIAGGGGGFVTGTFAYSSTGSDLIVSVGQGGPKGVKGGSGGGGGGYSGLFLGSKTHANAMIIAAGGGGGGDGHAGGVGGGTTGGTGTTGGGGTQSAGGAVSAGNTVNGPQPTAGSALQGGNGGAEEAGNHTASAFNGGGTGGSEPGGYQAGGGGGGGYYGGGGGHAGNSGTVGYGGGGGSSYHNPTYISSATNTSGTSSGPGYTGTNYPVGVGTALATTVGGHGAVWISYAITIPTGADVVLQSTVTTAEDVPTTGDLVLMIENATGTATINTDIKGYISRDSGVNWTQGTLIDEGSWGTNKKILAFHNLDISGQPSGTAMCYKLTTHNQGASKITRMHATSLAWA